MRPDKNQHIIAGPGRTLLSSVTAFILAALLSALTADAATIKVPQDYPTIQAGIDAAQDGDTVLVGPGTYNECIIIDDKGTITVASSTGPGVTIIDAKGRGTVVSIRNCTCTFQGFTLRNGKPVQFSSLAAAIESMGAFSTFMGNIIESNTGWITEQGPVGYPIVLISAELCTPIIEKNIFRNNSCHHQSNRCVIEMLSRVALAEIRDNLFLNNDCTAILFPLDNRATQVTNNTMVGNTGGMSGLIDSVIKNNIIVGNGEGVSVEPGYWPVWQNNLVYGNTVNYSGVADQTGINGNISAAPLFFDPANNDYHLCQGSPAIDAGDTTGIDLPTTDLDGNPRVLDGHIDIGAYEFNPKAAPRVTFDADKASGSAPFTAKFTSSVDRYVSKYLWNFGDTTSSTEADPSHTFAPGVYTVSLSVFGPTGTGSVTRKDLIESGRTITASAGPGGTISPVGETVVLPGSSLTYTVTPNPNYQLTHLYVDGIDAASPSTRSFTYSLRDIVSDHTISAVFEHYFNYFGMQAGNRLKSSDTLYGSITDVISLDTKSFPHPSYRDTENMGGTVVLGWFQIFPKGLFLKQMTESGYYFTFDPALPYIKTPLGAGKKWTGTSTITVDGISGTVTIRAKVSPLVLVNVPAGHFMAWPISYSMTVAGPNGTDSTGWTDWFAPYIGPVVSKSVSPADTSQLTSFAVGGGTVKVPPPVVTGTSPASGARGSLLTINGFQFGASQGSSVARIGNAVCDKVLSWSDEKIECTVPDTAVSGAVTVVTDTWTSNASVKFVVTMP